MKKKRLHFPIAHHLLENEIWFIYACLLNFAQRDYAKFPRTNARRDGVRAQDTRTNMDGAPGARRSIDGDSLLLRLFTSLH